MGMDEEDSIEQAAAARRERLRALKAAQELLNTPDGDASSAPPDSGNNTNGNHREGGVEEAAEEEKNPAMKFRNYVPQTKELQEAKVAPPVLPKFEDPVAAAPSPEEKTDPFVNIAPKKPNWDLRRDVQKKLDKLERRAQKAIYKLMEMQEKDKLLAENGENAAEC